MRPAAALLPLVVLLAALPPVAGSATAAGPGPAPVGTTMTVALQNDGDARWNVTMRFALAGENETAAFEEVAAAYENGSARVGPGGETIRALVERADGATDRTMGVAGLHREARVLKSGDAGILALEFTWRNFSAVENGTLTVGDAFPEDWSLAADQRLVVHPPSGYLLSTYFPGTDGGVKDGILRWDGPRTFSAGEPHVEYSLVGDGPGGGTDGGTTPGGEGAGNDPGALAAGALLIAGAALAAYVLAVRTRGPLGIGDDGDGGRDVVADGDAGANTAGAEAEARTESGGESGGADPAGDASEAGSGAGAEDTGAGAGGEAEPVPASDPELLSDEERVERLLRENGGRMKQGRIVEETGWSNAKVSQLLSGMAEDERVEKLRIGRENLISLPGTGEWGAEGGSGEGGGAA